MNLNLSQVNKTYLIIKIQGFCLNEYVNHMGVLEGKLIQVIQNNKGPILIKIDNSQIAIGRNMARFIFIKEVLDI